MADAREFLAVPYAERNAARAAGARWDATLKSWYVGKDADRAALARWMPGQAPSGPEPRAEFIETMTANGLLALDPHPVADGKSHRVPVEGDKRAANGKYSRPSGRYALHLDGHPAGYVRNFRKGTYAAWTSTGFRLPPHEMAALRADVAQKEKSNAVEQARLVEAAAARAQARTARLVPATAPTGYMRAKQIQPTKGALTDGQGVTTYLPAIDIDGKQWTLQTIRKDGLKLFQKDSRKEGTFHVVDGDLAALEPLVFLVVAEGYATSVVLAEAVRQPTIAAFDAGNLPAVASALHARWPAKPILVAGDDDLGVELREGFNPGRDKASAAAEAVSGVAVFPRFAAGEQESDPKGFTDFHDLAVRSRLGREGVRSQIDAALEELLVPPAGGIAKEAAMVDDHPQRPDPDQTRDRPPSTSAAAEPDPATLMPRDAIDRAYGAANGISGAGAIDRDAPARGADRTRETGQTRSYEVGDVPAELDHRYRSEASSWRLQRDYYESNSAPQPVFHDQGHKLVTEIESAAVIADLIAIAEHRGWQTIELSGTPEFRRDAWVRAQGSGIEATGYRPTERDRQEVAAAGQQRGPTGARVENALAVEADTPRLYLAVPFAEKEAAKAAGAQWDRDKRSWYVSQGQEAAVAQWMPERAHPDPERTIAGNRAAREQMRTIEAVVDATLANNPAAAQRVLTAGRETLAAKIERGDIIPPPVFRQERSAPDPAHPAPVEPALSTRKPPNRTRSR